MIIVFADLPTAIPIWTSPIRGQQAALRWKLRKRIIPRVSC